MARSASGTEASARDPAVPYPVDGGLDVVLVADVADDFLDDVLERHESGGTTKLVTDDGHVQSARAHVLENFGCRLAFAHEENRARE